MKYKISSSGLCSYNLNKNSKNTIFKFYEGFINKNLKNGIKLSLKT